MVDNPIRIALTGKLRSGKSLLASHFVTNYDFVPISFGTALKRVANDLFGDSPKYKGVGKPRQLYQEVGQTLRQLDEDVWVRQVAQEMSVWENLQSVKGVVIDDLRQPNEYEWAKANGFTIIRVNANEDTRLKRAHAEGDDFSLEDLRHDTEMHVDDYEVDYEIWNDDDVSRDELERKIDGIIDEIKAKGGR